MMWIKRHLYKRGFRPKQGSIFYSPSLELIHGFWLRGGKR